MPTDPKLPFALGFAGLIPFWGLSLAHVTGHAFGHGPIEVAFTLSAYAATIASFLGGIRWGLAVRETDQTRVRVDYIVSVLPQLVSWAAFAFPDRSRLVVLAIVLLVTGPLDYSLVERSLAPPWFGRLRMTLSLLAGASLLLAATA